MFNCLKCNKPFKYKSELERHNNNKNKCNKENNYNCLLCNSNFKYESDFLRHEKTKKHIINSNKENLNKSAHNDNTNQNDEIEYLKEKLKKLDFENKQSEEQLKKLDFENKKTEEKLKKLELENKILKESDREVDHNDQIYIIHERTFVQLNVNIYKIGRTKNIKRRFKEYTKGSKLLFLITCKNSIESESKILNYLKENKEKYKQEISYGCEYYRCNLEELQKDIISLII